jgi:DNA-binding transcriptional regulator YiaG
MTTLANALKEEIRRLARKEVKFQTARTAKAVARYRREIAALKREQRAHQKRIAFLEAQVRKSTTAHPPSGTNGDTRFSARSVKAQRRRTGLSAADYAKLVGVSPLTIYNWEHGKSRPRHGQFAALLAVRGLGKREAQAKLALLSASNGAPALKAGRRRRR